MEAEAATRERKYAWSAFGGRALDQPRKMLACFLAGQAAGIAFLGFWVLVFLAFRRDRTFEYPIRVVASFWLGGGTIEEPNALTYVFGILINQMIPAFAWSMVFAWILMSPRFPIRVSTVMTLGFVIGLAAMSFDVYLLVPPVMAVLHDTDYWWALLPRTWDWLAHIAYGLALGWSYLALRPRIEKVVGYDPPPRNEF